MATGFGNHSLGRGCGLEASVIRGQGGAWGRGSFGQQGAKDPSDPRGLKELRGRGGRRELKGAERGLKGADAAMGMRS